MIDAVGAGLPAPTCPVVTRRCLRSDWYALTLPWSSVLVLFASICIQLRL